jgi:hypothetical protein
VSFYLPQFRKLRCGTQRGERQTRTENAITDWARADWLRKRVETQLKEQEEKVGKKRGEVSILPFEDPLFVSLRQNRATL